MTQRVIVGLGGDCEYSEGEPHPCVTFVVAGPEDWKERARLMEFFKAQGFLPHQMIVDEASFWQNL